MFYPFPNLTKLFLLVNIVSMFLDIRLIRHIYFINFDICIHKEKRKIQTQNVPKAQFMADKIFNFNVTLGSIAQKKKENKICTTPKLTSYFRMNSLKP